LNWGQFTCREADRLERVLALPVSSHTLGLSRDEPEKEFLALPRGLVFAAAPVAAKAFAEGVAADQAKLPTAPRTLIDRHAESPDLLGVPGGHTSVGLPPGNTGRSKPRG